VPSDPLDDRRQQPCRLADPAAQRRTIEINSIPRVDLALPVERKRGCAAVLLLTG
jgi:hypothetical protein